MEEGLCISRSTDTATQRLRDIQMQECRDPETHLPVAHSGSGICKDLGMHRDRNSETLALEHRASWAPRYRDAQMLVHKLRLRDM